MHPQFKKGFLITLLVQTSIFLIYSWYTNADLLALQSLILIVLFFTSLILALINVFNLRFDKTRKLHLDMLYINSIYTIIYLVLIFIQFQELNT